LAGRLAASGRDAAWVVDTLRLLADGNFLYAQQALDGVAGAVLEIGDLGHLPPGLTDQFEWFFGRQFGASGRWSTVKPLLEVLVAAQEPLGERELAAGTGLDPDTTLAQAIQATAAYVRATEDDPPGRELYHRSLVEWLTDPKRKGATYR